MSTLQSIREKLRSLPFDGVSPSACAVPSVTMGKSSDGFGLYIVVGLIIGVLATVAIVKLWMSYRKEPEAGKPPPADQYVAQLAERIRNAPPVAPRVQPVQRPAVAPQTPSQYPEVVGDFPQPEPGGQVPPGYSGPVTGPASAEQPDMEGLDTTDPYLSPL